MSKAVWLVLLFLLLGCQLATETTAQTSQVATLTSTVEPPLPVIRADSAEDVSFVRQLPNKVADQSHMRTGWSATQVAIAIERSAARPELALPTVAVEEGLATPAFTATEVLTSEVDVATATSLTVISSTIGLSAENRPITAYRLGEGPTHIVLIGGIHGGYEWNTTLLAYQILDHLKANPWLVKPTLSIHIIPVANPDGLHRVVGKVGRFDLAAVSAETTQGRFNANQVDLNRNWNCQWQPTAQWRSMEVKAGTAAFSEPETAQLAQFLLRLQPEAVVWWHSAANGIYTAGCPDRYAPSVVVGQLYSAASGYPLYETFTAYLVTGDASDWLATVHIPSISVELHNHYDTDFEQNRRGVEALIHGLEIEP